MDFPASFLSAASLIFSSDPTVFAMQVGAIVASAVVIYTVLWTTKDVIARSRSTLFQVSSILLSAALPVVGFFLYLLLRPTTTNAERALRKDMTEILVRLRESGKTVAPTDPQKKQKIQKFVKRSLDKVAKSEPATAALL